MHTSKAQKGELWSWFNFENFLGWDKKIDFTNCVLYYSTPLYTWVRIKEINCSMRCKVIIPLKLHSPRLLIIWIYTKISWTTPNQTIFICITFPRLRASFISLWTNLTMNLVRFWWVWNKLYVIKMPSLFIVSIFQTLKPNNIFFSTCSSATLRMQSRFAVFNDRSFFSCFFFLLPAFHLFVAE